MLIEGSQDNTLSNYDERDILSDFSSEIAIDTINQQIDKLFDENDTPRNSADSLDNLIQKYNFLKLKYSDKEELISDLQDIMEETTGSILDRIQDKLGFQITFSDSLPFDDKIHYIHVIYNFFINKIEEGIESMLYNYFIKNVKSFPKKDIDKKDQVYLSIKPIIPNEYINQIFHSIDNIESIKEYNFTAEDIIELMTDNDPMEETNYWVRSIFVDNLFTDINYDDAFNERIMELVFRSNKIYKVQNLLIKKYSIVVKN